MPGRSCGLAAVGHQHRLAFDDVNKLVLAGMGVAQCREPARRQPGQIDPEIGQPEKIAERAPHAPGDPARKRFGIARPGRASGAVTASIAWARSSCGMIASSVVDRSAGGLG